MHRLGKQPVLWAAVWLSDGLELLTSRICVHPSDLDRLVS